MKQGPLPGCLVLQLADGLLCDEKLAQATERTQATPGHPHNWPEDLHLKHFDLSLFSLSRGF